MLRLLGIVFSGLIVASVIVPWVSGPQIGTWAPFDVVKNVDFSRMQPDQIKNFFSTPINGDPINATPWAIAAFAVSFPLAALFMLIGLMGYFSKPMGLFLGIIPLAVAGFAYYAATRVNQFTPNGFDIVSTFGQMVKTHQIAVGWGMIMYFAAATLLVLTALFASSRAGR